MIYTYLAYDDMVALRWLRSEPLYYPALGRVCRQTRREYRWIYLTIAPRHVADKLNMYTTNFDCRGLPSVVCCLPKTTWNLNTEGRTFNINILLTNTWTPSDLRPFIHGDVLDSCSRSPLKWMMQFQPRIPYTFEVYFDRQTFDIDFCRQALPKLMCTCKHTAWWYEWSRIQDAFVRAFKRYGNPLNLPKDLSGRQ